MNHSFLTKPIKWHVHPAKTQISLCIHTVWSESLLCAQWVAKDPRFLHADSEHWSDWADAQADPSLRWAHRSFCWFCHSAAQLFQLTSLVTGLVCHIYSYIDNPSVLNQLTTLGVVAQFEGLLSCHSDEMPMLEDMIVAVDDLATVTFTFFAETPQNKEISLKTLE